MKHTTFTADERLIEDARDATPQQQTTLHQASESATAQFDAPMDRLSYARPGRRFTRDERNER